MFMEAFLESMEGKKTDMERPRKFMEGLGIFVEIINLLLENSRGLFGILFGNMKFLFPFD